MSTTSDNDHDQPLGERPEVVLDLSYTHRDGRHVPVELRLPRDVPAWPAGEDILRAQAEAREAMARIDEQAGAEAAAIVTGIEQRYAGPSRLELVLLALTLAVLIAVTVCGLAHEAGVL